MSRQAVADDSLDNGSQASPRYLRSGIGIVSLADFVNSMTPETYQIGGAVHLEADGIARLTGAAGHSAP